MRRKLARLLFVYGNPIFYLLFAVPFVIGHKNCIDPSFWMSVIFSGSFTAKAKLLLVLVAYIGILIWLGRVTRRSEKKFIARYMAKYDSTPKEAREAMSRRGNWIIFLTPLAIIFLFFVGWVLYFRFFL